VWDDCFKYLSLYEIYTVALPVSIYKHLSCAAFKIKLTSGSGNAGTCEKLHDRGRIRLRQKAGVFASALIVPVSDVTITKVVKVGKDSHQHN
jgi:hypothetical protein